MRRDFPTNRRAVRWAFCLHRIETYVDLSNILQECDAVETLVLHWLFC